jgi:hypothetical protein
LYFAEFVDSNSVASSDVEKNFFFVGHGEAPPFKPLLICGAVVDIDFSSKFWKAIGLDRDAAACMPRTFTRLSLKAGFEETRYTLKPSAFS